MKDNQELTSQKTKLEALQKQKPPTDPQELVQYLMKRLDAAEQSIKVQEGVIMSERELRKMSSKYMKAQNKKLMDFVEQEKKNLSDKVSAELDATLKQAVREKVEIKIQLESVEKEKAKIMKDYVELQDMYNKIKQTQQMNEKLNDESQKMIDELEEDIREMKAEKEALQKANIKNTEERNKAIKDYAEIIEVIKKLDESRFVMNKLMGPDGALNPAQRGLFLSGNLDEHDKLLHQIGNARAGDRASANLQALNANPSKAYFNNAGIAGGAQPNAFASPYSKQNAISTMDENNEEDEFWYQTGADGGQGSAKG